MTAFDKIAKQMKQQGMSQSQINKWGAIGQSPTPQAQTLAPSTPTKRGSTPSKQRIAHYWLTQRHYDPSGMTEEQRMEAFEKLTPFQVKMVTQDHGEPACWACGYYRNTKADIQNPTHPNPFSSWDKAKWLQKCHIIPHMLGGSSEASNLVLLCKRCHKVAPDNKRPRYMLKFIGNRPNYYGEQLEMIAQIPRADLELTAEHMGDFQVWLGKNVGIHCAGDHRQTMASAVEDFAEDYRSGLITPEYIESIR